MSHKRAVFFAVMLALGGPALADKVILQNAMDKASFEASKARLTSQMEGSKATDFTAADKLAVLAALDRMDSRFTKITPRGQLTETDRMEMFNDQELVNTIVTHAPPESRLVCERERAAGSHRSKVVCMTLAIKKAREKAGQDAMDAIERRGGKNEMRRR